MRTCTSLFQHSPAVEACKMHSADMDASMKIFSRRIYDQHLSPVTLRIQHAVPFDSRGL